MSDIALVREFERQLETWTARPSDDFFARDFGGLWSALADGGWPLVCAPERVGGAALPLRELLQFAEAWGHHLLPVPLMPTVLMHRWTGGQVAESEPRSALTFRVPHAAGTSIVPFATWLTIRDIFGEDAGAPFRSAELELDLTAPSLPLGLSSHAYDVEPGRLDDLRTVVAAEAVGVACAVLADSIAYAQQRQAFGRTIVQFQAVRHLLADMHRDVELARSAAFWCAEQSRNRAAAMECLRLCRRTAAAGIQIFGGIGYTWDLGLHFYVRHVFALQRLADLQV